MSDFVLWAIRSHNRNCHRKKVMLELSDEETKTIVFDQINTHARTQFISKQASATYKSIHFSFSNVAKWSTKQCFRVAFFGLASLLFSLLLNWPKENAVRGKPRRWYLVWTLDMRHGHNSWKKGQIKNVIVMRKHFALRFHVSKLNVRYICLQQIRLDICFR